MLHFIARLFQFLFVENWRLTLVTVLGMVAVYLLLPRVRRYPPLWGAGLGSLAILLAGWLLVRAGAATPETILFYCFSAIAVVGGTLLIVQANPVHAALAFALVVLSTCGLFLLLAAPFLMAATTIIYGGAIIVTFLFVIMLAQQVGLLIHAGARKPGHRLGARRQKVSIERVEKTRRLAATIITRPGQCGRCFVDHGRQK